MYNTLANEKTAQVYKCTEINREADYKKISSSLNGAAEDFVNTLLSCTCEHYRCQISNVYSFSSHVTQTCGKGSKQFFLNGI